MDASTIMTRTVVTVEPDTRISKVARAMINNRISAVPVLDHNELVGIVTERDLLRRAEIGTEHQRSRWMELVFSNQNLATEYVREHGRKASDVMTRDVITVSPATPVTEIAKILESHHIKRVPVMENGKLVGIVSRANLIQALASTELAPYTGIAQDGAIQASLSQKMADERWAYSPTQTNVVVRNGEVSLWGYIGSEEARRAITVMAENTPGVRHVEDHMEYPPIPLGC